MIRALRRGHCRCCKHAIVDFPEEPKKRPPAKKDTKRWCGGHVGREHDPQWMYGSNTGSHTRQVCTRCGKVMGWCGLWSFRAGGGCKCGLHV